MHVSQNIIRASPVAILHSYSELLSFQDIQLPTSWRLSVGTLFVGTGKKPYDIFPYDTIKQKLCVLTLERRAVVDQVIGYFSLG